MKYVLLFAAALPFVPVLAGDGASIVDGAKFSARFDQGWLVEWKNKVSGEAFAFGKADLPEQSDYRHYKPGFWSIDPVPPEEEARRQGAVSFTFRAKGENALEFRQAVNGVDSRLKALQWGLRIPYENGLAVHWPRGLTPARVSGAGYPEGIIGEDFYFGNRSAALVGTHKLRSNAYIVQGKKGGLLIYMDNSDLKHFQAFEYLPIDPSYKVGAPDVKDHLGQGVVISNRSLQPPTAGEGYEGPNWVVCQYEGSVNVGAQIYQDFAARAYQLKPLSERPTAWVQDLGLVFVNCPFALRGPRTVEGNRQPAYDYLSEDAWTKGMQDDIAYLERLGRQIDPERVMLYSTEWSTGGHDTAFPEFNPDPYFAVMSRKARSMGFHVMIHLHNSLVQFPTTFTDHYILQTAKYLGLDPEKDHIPGVYFDELRNNYIYIRNKEYGSSWNDRNGQRRIYSAFHMNPACGGWRRLFVERIISAVLATHADAIHLDVPDWMIDRYNDRYGMNPIQGQVEFYRLLRQSLDENGLEHVAISCELTPNEAFMRYVDLAQRSRNNSAVSRMAALAAGSAMTQEELITLQAGTSLDSLLKIRKERASKEAAAPTPDREAILPLLRKTGADLGVPSLDSMVFSTYVQAYPHLGANLPDEPAGYLAAWYWPVNDCIPSGVQSDLLSPLPPFYRGVMAMGKFRVAEKPRIEPPGKWAAGDLALYQLKDGRRLRVFRLDETTQRYQFENGPVLADLDLFTGWKNAGLLLDKYGAP